MNCLEQTSGDIETQKLPHYGTFFQFDSRIPKANGGGPPAIAKQRAGFPPAACFFVEIVDIWRGLGSQLSE